MEIQEKLLKKEKCEQVAEILKALSHPQRLIICCSLIHKEKTVTELENICETSQPSISQHLTKMRLQGIIKYRRDGNFIYYSLSNPKITQLICSLEKIFCSENL